MGTVTPLNIDARADQRARLAVVDVVREHLGDEAGDAALTLLCAASVAYEDIGPAQHKPEHLLALITSSYSDLVAAVTR